MNVFHDPEVDSFLIAVGMHEGALVKQIPGASWNENRQCWTCRASWPAYVAICGVFAHNLGVDPSFEAWGRNAWESRYGFLRALRYSEDYPALTGPTAERLWPLQRVAVMAMVFAERYLEMDEMGGGKTRSTLAAMKLAVAMHGEKAVFPALVVCPNKVRRTWKREALTDRDGLGPFWGDLRIAIMPKGKAAQQKLLDSLDGPRPHALDGSECKKALCGGTKAKPCGGLLIGDEPPQVIVTNWESLGGLSRLEKFGNIENTAAELTPGPLNVVSWQTVVADEAHRAKDRKAKQTRALKAIAFGTPSVGSAPARFRYALTGTPVANNSAEVWSLLNFLDEIAWPAYSRMIERYASTLWNRFGAQEIGGIKPETREEFYTAFEPFGIRRMREQFDPFKPTVSEETYSVPMEPKQAKAYADMAKNMIAELDAGTVLATTGKMHRANRLHQLAQAFGEMVDKGRRDPTTGATLLDLQLKTPSNKVRALMELLEELDITADLKTGGRAVVVGAPSRQLIALCEEALVKAKIPYSLVAGGMSDHEQEQHERAFETGATSVALCVIQAAKEGLNSLIRADTLVFLQRSDSRVENEQFAARIDRPGQAASSITVIDIVSEGTLEEIDPMRPGQSKVEKLAEKAQNFQEVVADDRTYRLMLEHSTPMEF